MNLPLLTLPRVMSSQSKRAPQSGIPETREDREFVRSVAEKYVQQAKPVIPLSLEELRVHADEILETTGLEERFRDYVAVVLNAEANRDALARVPYDRRLLLLPKCLRVEDRCPAPFDEFGLLCKRCGLCTIQDLQDEAERLGYAVLTAEGSALVMAIIQTGKIDAIVGVSCLSVLEKAFPYMEAAAIPGVAIPLLQDDCKDTAVDIEWVWDFIHLTSEDHSYRLDLDQVRVEVDTWFIAESLAAIMGKPESETEQIAQEWLGKSGKRWRPFLAACAWKALQDDAQARFPGDLRKLAVAVECFHKASLVHDDIEDSDDLRYGEPSLHAQFGVPIALNVGDFLLGEGYRLIAETNAPPTIRAAMLRIAAEGHRLLCLGQGAELSHFRSPRPLTPTEVIEIHRRKTAPAFEVALWIGAAFAGADSELHAILTQYSESIGIAYQIRDDIEDLNEADGGTDMIAGRPSFPFAVAYERSKDDDRTLLETFWRGDKDIDFTRLLEAVERLGAVERSRQMVDAYKEQAVRVLAEVDDSTLKGLLRRVVSKIFSMEIKGWCGEFEARNAASGATRAEAVG